MKRLCFLMLASLLVVGGPVAAAQPGVAFDQITVYYLGSSATPPPPGSFAAQRVALPAAPSGTAEFPPVGGELVPSLGDLARLTHGVLYRDSFLGNRSRVDDPQAMRATISLPDKNEVIYLDLAAKTYRTVTGDDAKSLLNPEPAKALFAQPTPAPSATADQSTETIVATYSTSGVDGTTIDGVATRGLKAITTMNATEVTGTCPAITTEITIVRYVDPNRDEPSVHYDFSNTAKMMQAFPTLSCRFKLAPSAASPAPLPDEKRLSLYTLSETKTTVPALATPIVATVLVTRGNVKSLGPEDASLFDVPAGFTAASPPAL